MRTAWLLPMLVACYAPSAPSGVPCAPAAAGEARCPADQVCLLQGGVERCVPPGTVDVPDAAIDGAPPDGRPGDRDGDGVPDATDRCPDKADPMQYDEDGDGLGDVCDPCPVSSNNADGDGDGVGDDCDPNPAVAGDKIALFDGLNQGVPAGWTRIGTWGAVPGAVSVTGVPNVDAILGSPFNVDPTSTLTTAFVSGGNVPDANAGFGVAHAADAEGVLCGVITDGIRLLALIDVDTDNFINEASYNWTNQTAYITGQVRRNTSFRCYSIDPQGASRSVAGSTNEVPAMARFQLRSRGISGRFLWLLHVESP
jgi:hypothetical protein